MLVRVGPPRKLLTASLHNELDRGTLRSILRKAGISVEQL